MIVIIGLILVHICTFGVFLLLGGNGKVLLNALPFEMVTIMGSGIGALIISNDLSTIRDIGRGLVLIFKGSKWKKRDFIDIIILVSNLMKTLRTKGPRALESEIETPASSSYFQPYSKLLKDDELVHLITDTIRIMIVSSGNLNAYAVEEVMDIRIKQRQNKLLHASSALLALSGALPALGIVACVLGIVKTMSAIDQPPEILGGLIGAALLGTFLGVFLSYGIIEPLAKRMEYLFKEECQIFFVVKHIFVATLHGHPQPLVIEAARAAIGHHEQPSFNEVFDQLLGR